MKYRSEIDGLRALAVVPVILYHAGVRPFGGGFIGVDVFFVISGYLITRIILDELKSDSFSVSGFYERRARRILPALFFVVLTTLPFAWLWMTPPHAKNFSASLVAFPVFASNLLFWRTSGYFDSASELKPLIHTWSLAVEEQYYVFFPLFMILTRRWPVWRTVGVLAMIAFASLAAAQWGVSRYSSAAFYLLPTRAWELLVGVLIAFYYLHNGIKKYYYPVAESGSLLGFILIVYSIFAFNDKTPFPGLYALLPTLGAALVVVFATNETTVGKLLSTKWFVFIGLISYSAYLWHQPLLALARQRALGDVGHLQLTAVILGSFALAYLSWRFVERPFRNKQILARSEIFSFGAAASVFFIAIGLFGYLTQGLAGRYGQAQKDFFLFFENSLPKWAYLTRENIHQEFRNECDFYDIEQYRSGNSTMIPRARIADECYKKDSSHSKTAFIWGDSHAKQLYPGLSKTLPADWKLLQVASSGCNPSLDGEDSDIDYCKKSNWFALKQIEASSPDVVIIGQNGGHNSGYMDVIAQKLKSVGVGKVIFTGPTPHWNTDLPIIVATKLWDNTPEFSELGLDKSLIKYNSQLKDSFKKRDGVYFVSIIDYFCTSSGCRIYFDADRQRGITTWDYGHLTPIASLRFAKDVLASLVMQEETTRSPIAHSMQRR